MSETTEIEALLEAHELIVVEREQARHEFDSGEFTDGHTNGLSEARNRVEQCILNRVNNLECHKGDDPREVAKAMKEAIGKRNEKCAAKWR